MKNKDIAIIINSFNRLSLMKECLKALSNWIPNSSFSSRCTIIIYDAGSTDGTLEWLSEESNGLGLQIELIIPKQGDDTSFAAGLNKGVNVANAKMPNLKYLIFYETDNQILNSTPLIQAFDQINNRKDLGACGFTVRYHNGSPAGAGMMFPKLYNFALGQRLTHFFNLEAIPYKWEDNNGVPFSEVDVVFTSPLLVRLDAWRESKGLDEKEFPFSDCDIDWAKRLREVGWKMGVIKTNDVIHDNSSELSAWSMNRALHFHRARLKYFRRYKPVKTFLIWPIILVCRHFFELIIAKLFIKDKERKKQLTLQFSNLLKLSVNQYNPK